MCGIAGYVTPHTLNHQSEIEKMTGSIHHRGPDDTGFYITKNNEKTIALGHKRLSILDLTEGGHQPMHYKSYTIVFNGEIYNYLTIKNQLSKLGHIFLSHSDTEVILHAYEEWGIACVEKFIGMFAFALWDASISQVLLVRDRLGIKPLYFSYQGENLVFGSELKSLMACSLIKKEINISSAAVFFQYGYISQDQSILNGVQKVNPGSYICFDLQKNTITQKKYWDIAKSYHEPKLDISFHEAEKTLQDLFVDAFSLRMLADVPVGVFLSGGYDSSLVAAILVNNGYQNLNTFTVSFEQDEFDESMHAKKVAEYLGTTHYEYACTKKEAQDMLIIMSDYFDEPYGDVSLIPSLLLSQKTKQKVTVALSADGGDEIFGGYDSYKRALKYFHQLKIFNKIPGSQYPFQWASHFVPDSNLRLKHNLSSLSSQLNTGKISPTSLLEMISQKNNLTTVKDYFHEDFVAIPTPYRNLKQVKVSPDALVNNMLLADMKTYLVDDILVKVDRCTMAYSLEGREPLLDHRIIEFAARLPSEYKYDGKTQKKILKSICHQYLPENIMNRPKQGFTLPLYDWLRTDLKDFSSYYLSDHWEDRVGLFKKGKIKEIRTQFFKGNVAYYDLAWYTIVFNKWMDRWMN